MSRSTLPTKRMQPNKIIPWHPLFNRWLKSTLTPADVNYNDEVYATSEPAEIDAVLSHAGSKWSTQQRALLPDGIRDRQMRYHLLEFKITESVNMDAVEQTFSYDYWYRKSQNLSKSQLQTYIVSAKTPRAATLAGWGYKVGRHPGVYTSPWPFFNRITILVLNQLRAVPHNNYFRLFASQKKVRESAIASLIEEQEWALLGNQASGESENGAENIMKLSDAQLHERWAVLYAMRRIYGLEGIRMEVEMSVDEIIEMGREEYRRSIIERFPVEDRLAGLDPRVRLAGLDPQERLAGLDPQERLAGLDPQERVAGLDPKERLAGLDPKDRVAGLDPQERLAGLAPKEIVGALEPEEMLHMMQEIELFLATQRTSILDEKETSETEISDEE